MTVRASDMVLASAVLVNVLANPNGTQPEKNNVSNIPVLEAGKPGPRKPKSRGKVDKFIRRIVDKVLGAPVRYLMSWILGAFVAINYKVTRDVDPKAFEAKDGAIAISNHQSLLDGQFILLEAWPFAWVRPAMWHKVYNAPVIKYLFRAIGAIELGSPKHLPTEVREERKIRALEIMNTLLRRGWAVLIFPEGSVGDGSPVNIPAHFVGTYDLIHKNPDKPVFMIHLEGFEKSRFGRGKVKGSLWKRLPIKITVKVFEKVDVSKGPADLNARLNAFWNEGKDL